jgi:hypothetical protein
MARLALRVVIAAGLIGTGWIVGHAQTSAAAPDFEISIVAPAGKMTVTCVRGCEFGFSQVKNGVTTASRINSFTYGCPDAAGPTCEYRTGGWVSR